MSAETRYWFRAKRYGWGWGLPCSWQGWMFFLIWLGALLAAAVGLMPGRPFLFTLVLAAMTVLFVAICYLKGEPLLGGSKIQ